MCVLYKLNNAEANGLSYIFTCYNFHQQFIDNVDIYCWLDRTLLTTFTLSIKDNSLDKKARQNLNKKRMMPAFCIVLSSSLTKKKEIRQKSAKVAEPLVPSVDHLLRNGDPLWGKY